MTTQITRKTALDLARFLAFAGMVLVNYQIVIASPDARETLGAEIAHNLEGRAAALFVVLAGFGLGLLAQARPDSYRATTLKRALFLFALGLVNMLWFSADILHFYAAYFVVGAFAAGWSSRLLWSVAAAVPLVHLALLSVLDYETGWNWETYEYLDLWTLEGFARHLLFNGWHPVLPWVSFLLVGLGLSRLDWSNPALPLRALILGIVLGHGAGLPLVLFGEGLSDEELILLGTSPIPPMPLYILAGTGVALETIGLTALLLRSSSIRRLCGPLITTGRQSLTLYIAHILIGMSVLEALGLIHGGDGNDALLASAIMVLGGVAFANLWARRSSRGPLEQLMRRLT